MEALHPVTGKLLARCQGRGTATFIALPPSAGIEVLDEAKAAELPVNTSGLGIPLDSEGGMRPPKQAEVGG